MTKLSEHFTLEELTYSDTARKYNASNLPTEIHKKTLQHTCVYFLEVLRLLLNCEYAGKIAFNKIVKSVILNVTSGYRSRNVNQLLKREGYHPSETSQHCTGEAVDIEAVLIFVDGTRKKLPYTTLYSHIKFWVKNAVLSVDQCLQEKQGSMYWVHCSYKAGGSSVNRKDFKITKDGVHFITDKI